MAAAKMALACGCSWGGKPGGGCIQGTCDSEDAAAGWRGLTAGCVSCDCEASTGVTWAAGTSCESGGGDATKIEVPTCCTPASPVADPGSTPNRMRNAALVLVALLIGVTVLVVVLAGS